MVRISRAAIDALRLLIEDHLRREYAWPGGDSFNEIELDESDFVEFLYAAIEYVRDAYPLIGRRGAVVDSDEIARNPSTIDLFTALLHLEPRTVDACLAAVIKVVPIEIVDASPARRLAPPRVYRHFPRDWPDVLGSWVGARDYDAWFDHIFGVVAEAGWIRRRDDRNKVFVAIDPTYAQMSFVELDRETALRLARFLLAGAENRGAFKAYDAQARALISLFGPDSELFSNRDLDEDELRDPFAHGESVDLGTRDCCAGGIMLALLVSDGRRVVELHALWDRWVES